MPETIRILMLEDTPSDAELAERTLRRSGLSFTSRLVETCEAFVAALREFQPHVVLADFSLPAFNGLEALAITRELTPTTPVLIVTGSLSEETAADCIKAGAVDYVLKERLARLPSAVHSALEHRRAIEEKVRAEEELRAGERKYRALFTESQDGIFIADATTERLLDANAAMLAMSGYRVDQVRDTSLITYVPPEYLAEARKAWEATVRGGTVGALEMEFARADGTRVPVEVRASAYTEASGAVRLFGIVRDISERRQRERELLASEQRHRALFEEAANAIFIADRATGMLLDANRAAREMAGRDVEELRRMHQSELHAPEERAFAEASFARDFGSPAQHEGRLHVRHRDGHLTPVEILGNLMTDEMGRPIIVGVFRDVTERRAAEAAARESQAQFEQLVEGAPEGILIHLERRIDYMNPTGLRIVGATSPDQLIGTDFIALFDPRFHDAIAARTHTLTADQQSVPMVEAVMVRLDGTGVDVDVTAVPFTRGDKRGAVVFFRDITEQKRANDERARLSAAFDQAAEVAIITDLDGNMVYVNSAFERVTGYSRAEAIGQNPRLLKSGAQNADVYRRLWETLARGEAFSGQLVNRKKNGDHYIAEVVVFPVRDGEGSIRQYVGLQRDVTREHELEEQLRQSQKVEAIGQLTGGIAHDFNNLLGVILANASLLDAALQGQDPELWSYLADIEQAAEAGSAMVKKLLAFGRRERLAATPLDLGTSLRELERTLRRFLPETIVVRLDIAEPGAGALADPVALEQIVLNLATNARDAMPGGGTLTLGLREIELHEEDGQVLHELERPGRYACLSVTDTGTGMDAATLARAFDPFFTTKPPGAGTGLGLPMVFGLVKQHGGFVRVYSELGHGTTARLYFPAGDTAASIREVGRAQEPQRRGTETILVVEDQAMLRRATARALEQFGYQVLVAADGAEGLRMFTAHAERVHLVLSDRVMPEMGGVELYERLRAEGHQVPFLLMSGYASDAGGITPVPAGLSVVEKPWTMEDLAAKVRALIDAFTSS